MKKAVVPFARARETSLYGSKAVGLGDAARQGLPVSEFSTPRKKLIPLASTSRAAAFKVRRSGC